MHQSNDMTTTKSSRLQICVLFALSLCVCVRWIWTREWLKSTRSANVCNANRSTWTCSYSEQKFVEYGQICLLAQCAPLCVCVCGLSMGMMYCSFESQLIYRRHHHTTKQRINPIYLVGKHARVLHKTNAAYILGLSISCVWERIERIQFIMLW